MGKPEQSVNGPRVSEGTQRGTSDDGVRDRIAEAIRDLARARAPKTVCPSEIARGVGGEQWRALMPAVREVADELAVREEVVVTQRGERVSAVDAKGPIRLSAAHGS